MKLLRVLLITFLLLPSSIAHAQDIELFQQFNGRYDYTAIGNTLNPGENNIDNSFCVPLESSSAELNLSSDNTIISAYLYWAGSGSGDTSVALNGITIDAEDTYLVNYNSGFGPLTYFSCYANITDIVLSEGNTNYVFSDLDISETLTTNFAYCFNSTNFAGWCIYIIYENNTLPLNQVNLYQGLEIINSENQEKTIQLNNLNVIDNVGAKIGFLAWEGDNALNFGESLSFNGNILSNPPLNLSDNAFNGTNTFTNSNTYYNCDLDVYDIENNINIGDTSATIVMTTGEENDVGNIVADLIILNNIITVLNSQLPDATIAIDDIRINCENTSITVDYTVFNVNSTDQLPPGTPIAFYADGTLLAQSETQNVIPINSFETGTIIITVPETVSTNFEIILVVDDNGSGIGIVPELNESNNSISEIIEPIITDEPIILPTTQLCNEGFNSAVFDLWSILEQNGILANSDFEFFRSIEDFETNTNPISIPEAYVNESNPQNIYTKIENAICSEPLIFTLGVENCPPRIPQGFSPNNDAINDWFNIQGLYDIFLNHRLKIFNRYGTLIFEGDNETPWNGRTNRGINNRGSLVPVGTYFYILDLNDSTYPSTSGWVYVNY